jgi:hypothetical protein
MRANVGNLVLARIYDEYETEIIGIVEARIYDDGYLHCIQELFTKGNPNMHRSPYGGKIWVWDFEIIEITQANT